MANQTVERIHPVPGSASRRVLVVEDEPLIAFDLISEIESGNHQVVGHCRTADEAVIVAGRERPDIVVMDIGLLGEGSGLEAAQRIRDDYGIGCVFVSATLDRVDPDCWGDIDPVALIAKPYRDRALARAIGQSEIAPKPLTAGNRPEKIRKVI